jgi:hypothetical protein
VLHICMVYQLSCSQVNFACVALLCGSKLEIVTIIIVIPLRKVFLLEMAEDYLECRKPSKLPFPHYLINWVASMLFCIAISVSEVADLAGGKRPI